jgi:hypothetical protein
MFTGFASENTPAIQVWDFFQSFASSSAIRSVSLPDDCAPIQVFRTGGATTAIRVYLPTAPIEGKQITIVNQQYGINTQGIELYSSDVNGGFVSTPILALGSSSSIVLVYSKQAISFGTSSGSYATGWISLNQSSVGSITSGSAIVGGRNNFISSKDGFIGGGTSHFINGGNAAIVGGLSNTATGTYSAVVGGSSNTASGTSATVVGGTTNTANSAYAAVIAGNASIASITNAVVVGGQYSTANGVGSIVIGGSQGTTRSITGNFIYPASNSPITFESGKSQLATLSLGRQTTDATATRLASDTGAAGTTNQVILPNNSAYTFQGTCIAARTAAGDTSSWKFEGAIKRGANAASTVLVAAVTPTVIAQDAGAAAWVLAITADTTNGGIAVTVTGAAATTIRWVVKIETTEVTF